MNAVTREREIMGRSTGTLRTCERGHEYYKSSDCPTCPTCEAEAAPTEGFLAKLSAPARRALEHEGITTLEGLARYTRKEVLGLHGVGPASIPALEDALDDAGLSFRDEDAR